jgi:hypothetical protein
MRAAYQGRPCSLASDFLSFTGQAAREPHASRSTLVFAFDAC